MEKKTKFKVGDKVYARLNSPWGRRPMKIVDVRERGCTCRNPEFTGEGWFLYDELLPFTKERSKLLHALFLLEGGVDDLKESLFGK